MKGILSIIYVFMIPVFVFSQDRVTGHDFATRSEVIARNGMAATSQPLATQVALDILKKGGNAFDAAIAANAVLGVVEPTGCGVGGDLFAIIWSADKGKLYGLNASGGYHDLLNLSILEKIVLKRYHHTDLSPFLFLVVLMVGLNCTKCSVAFP